MNGSTGGAVGSEAFGTACGLAVIVGALAVVAPELDLLVAAMVALGLAGWASVHRRGRPRLGPGAGRRAAYAIAFSVLGAGVVLFVAAPAPLGPWRPLLLGLGVLPLWTVERRRTGRFAEGAT